MGNATQTTSGVTVGHIAVFSDVNGDIQDGGISIAGIEAGEGTGTVTSTSVVSANGLAGTVANPTTTPAITLSTTVTGLLKGNGAAISAAVSDTDYQAPISLTTTGTSGAATFSGNTLNIPNYAESTGTVTSASVVSANGLAGTVANPTTTPAITLSTTVTGLLKGNGAAISAAVSDTDYQAPISVTTTGTTGAATFSGNTLNIPNYTSTTVSPVTGANVNLVGSSAGSAQTATWTADELVAKTALGGTAYIGSTLSLSFNGATTGANGMDTGSMPTTGALYIYAIYNPTTTTWAVLGTTSGSGSTVYSGANMPSGYTASCLIWMGATVSTNFPAFKQIGHQVEMASLQIGGGSLSGETSNTAVSISPLPAAVKGVSGYISQVQSSSTAQQLSISSSSAGLGQQTAPSYSSGIANTGLTNVLHFESVIDVSQNIYYYTGNTTASSVNILLYGYVF